ENLFAERHESRSVLQPALEPVCKERQTWADVTHNLGVWEKDRFDGCRHITDMNHLRATRTHKEWGLFNRIVADRHDQIRPVDSLMNIVTLRERRRSHVEIGSTGDRALAHLRIKERNPNATNKIRERIGQSWPVCGSTHHDQRAFGTEDHRGRAI